MSPAMHGYGSPQFVTLGMFIIDEFSFLDDDGNPTGKELAPQERLTARLFERD